MNFPKEIMIEITNNCNNRCFFCGSIISERKRGFMESGLMKRLIREAYENGAQKISFHGMGEPFLEPKLSEYVSLAKELGYQYIYLDTNGILATPDRVNPVLDAGLDSLKFSIHAASADTYKKITGNDSYHVLIDNIQKMSAYKRANNIPCRLIAYFAVSTINETEQEQFREIMSPYFDDVWIMPIHNGSGVMQDNNEKYSSREDISIHGKCKEIYERMVINWEGKAIACSTDWTDSLIYGNVKENSLAELWESNELKIIREEHEGLRNMREVCRKCRGIQV